jgi:hypothetical protein
MMTLESQWKVYRDACYPAKNGALDPLQESETRQAFFAGCLTVLKFAVESSANLPEEQAYNNIVSLIREAQMVCSQRIYEMKGRN